ncbi:hypothetical protein AB0D46_28560 [Streptomyces sp. NPDC048383]|uniref:hypothetical protein n=1 Tax=Streptomyces sp. NPDC048383 TaxID=3155386 RepID=UPI00344429D3
MIPEAPPTPQEIARAFELDQEHANATPADQEQGYEVAQRIFADYVASGASTKDPDLLQFIKGQANSGSVTNEDRGVHRAFWSYESKLEGVGAPVPNRFLARACGESRGLQVLEDTPVGHQLNSYFLDNRYVVEALAEAFKFDPVELRSIHGKAWDTLSERFAQETEGLAVSFAADITENSVIGNIEIPALLKNSKVGKEGIKFATRLPLEGHEHLPPDVHGFMSNDAVRCQLRKGDDDPQKSPEEFAKKLAAIDVPEDQKEAHSAIVARLSEAKSYEELHTAPPEPKQKGPSKRARAFMPGMSLENGIPPAAPARGPTGHGVMNPVAAGLAPKPAGIEH